MNGITRTRKVHVRTRAHERPALTWFVPSRVRLGLVVLTLSMLGVGAVSAHAASIAYVGPDGNVYLASPDGSVRHQVTRDGSVQDKYRSPSQTDSGTVAAVRRVGSSRGTVQFLDRFSGRVLDSWLLPIEGGGSFAPLTGGEISSGGALFVYDWNYFNVFPSTVHEMRVSILSGPAQTNPCLTPCAHGYIRPRWIAGTPYVGFIDDDFDGISVRTETGVKFWFGIDGVDTLGFDVEGDRTVVAYQPDGAPRFLAVVQNGGAPPTPNPELLCTFDQFGGDAPRFAPGGAMIAWEQTDGIYVSPTPTEVGGGACTLQPRLVVPGGTKPEWGTADTPAPPPPPPPPAPPVDTTAPQLHALKVSPRHFVAASRGPSIVTSGASTVSYELSESAAVSFTVQRAVAGRRVGGRCVKATPSARRAKRCTRYRAVPGGFQQPGTSGSNRLRFSGWLRNRKLAPGAYRLQAVAKDAAGNTSPAQRRGFQILSRRGRNSRDALAPVTA